MNEPYAAYGIGEWVYIEEPGRPTYKAQVISVQETRDGVEYTLQQFPDAPTWSGITDWDDL
jgi:hypothetical protein